METGIIPRSRLGEGATFGNLLLSPFKPETFTFLSFTLVLFGGKRATGVLIIRDWNAGYVTGLNGLVYLLGWSA